MASIDIDRVLLYRVEGIAQQVQQYSTDLLWYDLNLTHFFTERSLDLHLQAWHLRPFAVIGQIDVLRDELVDVRRFSLAGSAGGMLHHRVDNAVGPPTVLVNLRSVLLEISQDLSEVVADLGHRLIGAGVEFVGEFVGEFDRELGEVVDEVERVLDLVGDARRQLPQRGHLFGMDEQGLGVMQLGQGSLQLIGFVLRVGVGLLELVHEVDQCGEND